MEENSTHQKATNLEPISSPANRLALKAERQRFGDFITQLTPEMQQAIDNQQIRFVFQKGIGLTSGEDPAVRYLQTESVGSCVAVIGFSATDKKTALVHLDQMSDVAEAARLFKQHFGDNPVELSLIGGQEGKSEHLVAQVTSKFGSTPNWIVARAELLTTPGYLRQVLVDTANGSVYLSFDHHKMYPWGWNQPATIKTRYSIAGTDRPDIIQDYPINAGQSVVKPQPETQASLTG